jgi:hypothetical protein
MNEYLASYSQTSFYVLNWSKMVVLIAKRTQIKILDFRTHIWSGLIGQWPSQKLQNFVKPLHLQVNGFNWSLTFPKKFHNFLKT